MKRTESGAWLDRLRGREDQVSIILSFVIGALGSGSLLFRYGYVEFVK
jgi:hypothetical protein